MELIQEISSIFLDSRRNRFLVTHSAGVSLRFFYGWQPSAAGLQFAHASLRAVYKFTADAARDVGALREWLRRRGAGVVAGE